MLKALFTDEADKNRPYLFFVNDAEIKGKLKKNDLFLKKDNHVITLESICFMKIINKHG